MATKKAKPKAKVTVKKAKPATPARRSLTGPSTTGTSTGTPPPTGQPPRWRTGVNKRQVDIQRKKIEKKVGGKKAARKKYGDDYGA